MRGVKPNGEFFHEGWGAMERDSLAVSGRCESTQDFGHGELGGVRPCNARVVGILQMESCCGFVRKNVLRETSCHDAEVCVELMMMAVHMVENGNINTIVEQRSLGSIGQEFFIYMN